MLADAGAAAVIGLLQVGRIDLIFGTLPARELIGEARTQLRPEGFEPVAGKRMDQPGLEVATGWRARRAIEDVAHDVEGTGVGRNARQEYRVAMASRTSMKTLREDALV